MGIFDKVLGKKDEGPITMNEREAFAAVCVLAVAADGVIEEDEVRRVVISLSEKRLYRGQRVDDLGRLLNTSARLVQRRGPGPVMEAAKNALSTELRETAFALATDLVLADGDVDAKEKQFLEEFQRSLGISEDLALKVAEVMVIKNRG